MSGPLTKPMAPVIRRRCAFQGSTEREGFRHSLAQPSSAFTCLSFCHSKEPLDRSIALCVIFVRYRSCSVDWQRCDAAILECD